jgi:hypothetical protein
MKSWSRKNKERWSLIKNELLVSEKNEDLLVMNMLTGLTVFKSLL